MYRSPTLYGLVLLAGLLTAPLWGQRDYRDGAALERSIQALEQQYGEYLEASTLTETAAGHPIWLLTIGSDDRNTKPGVAIVGGVAGHHLLGQELAMGVAENLLAGTTVDSIQQLLEEVTFYVFPQVSPDAATQYFSGLRYERQANGRDTDTDRDGYTNEDPGEDLNGDGLLTMMRIAAPDGEYVMHPADARVMRKATAADPPAVRYHLLPEGRDNDMDGQHSEDGPGGIFFNKNWTFQHPTFKPGAGEYAVSEVETRAIADFLYDRFNIFSVITFGPSENLHAPLEYRSSNDRQRVITGILKGDAEVNKQVSGLFQEVASAKKGVRASTNAGGFMEWTYFHYGRFGFGTPGWYVPDWQMPEDEAEAAQYKPNDDKNADVNFLRWAEAANVENAFVEWTEVRHPDFPDQTVEVGGMAPFVQLNPPYGEVRELASKHTDFAVRLGQLRAQVALTNIRQEQVDEGLWRVKATLVNTGQLPTTSEIGDRFNWLKRLRVDFGMADNQALSTGQEVYLFPAMQPGEARELSWLVRGNGTVTIEAGSPHVGTDSITLNLQ